MFFVGDGSGVSRSVPPDALLMVIQRDAEGDTERRSLIQEKRHRYGFSTLVNQIIFHKPHNCGFFYVKLSK